MNWPSQSSAWGKKSTTSRYISPSSNIFASFWSIKRNCCFCASHETLTINIGCLLDPHQWMGNLRSPPNGMGILLLSSSCQEQRRIVLICEVTGPIANSFRHDPNNVIQRTIAVTHQQLGQAVFAELLGF